MLCLLLPKISASSVGFPLGHGYLISLSFSFYWIRALRRPERSFFAFFRRQMWIYLRTKKEKRKEWGSPNPSNLKADVTWLPTSKGPVNCRAGEIIYLWLAFSLVNVNELSTWLPGEPWPWPPGQYIIRLQKKNTHFCFNFALLRLISDLQIVKLTLEKPGGLDQISTRPPAPG